MNIATKQSLVGEIHEKQKLVGTISGTAKLSGEIAISNTVIVDYDEFEGPYEVKPLVESQTIPTKDKLMQDDLVVLAVPYAEVTNLSNGITVTIGE